MASTSFNVDHAIPDAVDPVAHKIAGENSRQKDYQNRIKAPERALAGGLRYAGLGALLGLSDPVYDMLALYRHARHLQKKYWKAGISLSFPRIQPQRGDFNPDFIVDDTYLAQIEERFRAQEIELVRSAVQLYTAAFERYVKAMRYETSEGKTIAILPMASQQDLLTVLIEGEKHFIRISRSERSPRFVPEVKKLRWRGLNNAFDRLLGSRGDVQRAFEIYPPNTEEGQRMVQLPGPPDELVQRALILEELTTIIC